MNDVKKYKEINQIDNVANENISPGGTTKPIRSNLSNIAHFTKLHLMIFIFGSGF